MSSPTPQPTAVDVYSQAAPWTNSTPDRILKTTAVPGSLPYVGYSPWTQNTNAYSAVSPADPVTGQRYFCLLLDGTTSCGMRYDFALNPVSSPDSRRIQPGFSALSPVPASNSLAIQDGLTSLTQPRMNTTSFVAPELQLQTRATLCTGSA